MIFAAFASPARFGGMGMGGMGAGGLAQGTAMELVEFTVDRAVTPVAWKPRDLPHIVTLDPSSAKRTRTFQFNSAMMPGN